MVKALKNFQMEINTRASIKKANQTGEENMNGTKEGSMKVSL